MPEFDGTIQTKIAALRAIMAASQSTVPYEICKIDWPSPTGAIYYATTQVDEVASVAPPVSPIETRLLADSLPDSFLPVQIGEEIGDEEVDLKFWDGRIHDEDGALSGDGAFSDLMLLHGEGVKVELFYWFPQVELLLPVWHGHLRNEENAERYFLPVKAVQGFRSNEGTLPSRAHYTYCNAVFGGLLDTQAAINEHGCPYNLHISGIIGTNDPDTGEPWTYCNRRGTQSCTDRGVDPLYHLSHNTIQITVANGQTKGPTLYSTTEGNQTNLKDPVAVVMGQHRVWGVLIAFRRDLNNNHPEDGWFAGIYEMSEGPIVGFSSWAIILNDRRFTDPSHYRYRLGTFGQTAVDPVMTTHSFSHTALIKHHSGWIDPSTVNESDAAATAIVTGLSNIRVYSDEDTYSEIYTTNPAWQLARMLCDKIWGFGLDYDRLNIQSFIDAAAWCDEYVRFTDTTADYWDHQRSTSNVELRGKKVQQQIEDLCRSHRLSRPFLFDGKIHIVPLRKLTDEELEAAPVFTTTGENRNICVEQRDGAEVPTLRVSRHSDLDLPNRIECTFNNVVDDWKETALRPVEDVTLQLRAGRVLGDNARKINTKKFNLLGVTGEAEAWKVTWSLLDLGEFDEGGLMNNCTVQMTIWYLDALDLHPWKVVKIEDDWLNMKYGFEYFRVMKIERQEDLLVELELQAYAQDYYEYFEVLLSDIVDDEYPLPPGVPPGPIPSSPSPPPDDPPGPEPDPCRLRIDSVGYLDGVLGVRIERCIETV